MNNIYILPRNSACLSSVSTPYHTKEGTMVSPFLNCTSQASWLIYASMHRPLSLEWNHDDEIGFDYEIRSHELIQYLVKICLEFFLILLELVSSFD